MRARPTVPTRLPTPPEAVVARLRRQGLPMHSVWFPSRADVARWSQSGSPLYVLPAAGGRIVVGPRVDNMWASAFSPILALTLQPDGADGTHVIVERRLGSITRAILLGWSLVLLGWGGGMVAGVGTSAVLFWALLVLATIGAPLVGWWRGGEALDAGIPWLTEVLLAPDDLEDW